jgi:hypothetical protein
LATWANCLLALPDLAFLVCRVASLGLHGITSSRSRS